ncbi:hypothetical protein BDW75DRAFT_239523 [Aspergillus navahoensis]
MPFVFSEYVFYGSSNDVKTLWRLLRTVVENSDLAGLIKVKLGKLKEVRRSYHAALFRESLPWLDNAFKDVRFDQGTGKTVEVQARKVLGIGILMDGYQCPLVALLVAYCPNLNSLKIHDWPADLDSWFGRILGYAVGRVTKLLKLDHRPMQALNRLVVAPKLVQIRDNTTTVDKGNPCVTSEENRPFYLLPELKNLPATLSNARNRMCLSGDADRNSLPREDNDMKFIKKLYDMLDRFKKQLVYLDIYQVKVNKNTFSRFFSDSLYTTSICRPFVDFINLR